MRARMALDAAEIAVAHREVLLRDKPAAMLAASPKGTVPVLVLPDGTVIDESLDIMIWALSRHDPEGWTSETEADRRDVEQFLEAFKDRLDRYKYASRYDESIAREAVDHKQRAEALAVLLDFASNLSHTTFLRADRPRLIDVATFPFVRQFAAVEPDWWAASIPQDLQDWLKHWLESDRFQRIMTKHRVWTPESTG